MSIELLIRLQEAHAFDHAPLRHDLGVYHVPFVKPVQLDVLEFAKTHPGWDRFYRSRSTRVVGLTPGNHMLEVVLRREGRAEDERCIVFHARYL